jgi:exopolysaccharide production protein ExoQ
MARLPISRSFLENSILGVAAFVLSTALIRVLTSGNTNLVTAGDRRFELLLVLVYGAVLLIGAAHPGKTLRMGLHTPALIALMALTCVSCMWAEMPGLVLRRALGVAGATLFGLVLASCLDFEDQLMILRRIGRLAAGLSYAAWAAGFVTGSDLVSGEATTIKGYSVQIEAGAWRGIFNHKNDLGAMMALAILVEWHVPAETTRAKIAKTIWMCAYSSLLLLSHSLTSIVALGLTILLMFTIKTFRHQYRVILPVLLLATMFSGTLIALNTTSVTGALGRSADLTGRADLWHWVVLMIADRPLLGYGFSGFWKGASEQSAVVEDRIGWSPVYAHNGYLEITLSLGLAGLLLFLWFAATGLRRAVLLAKGATTLQELWPLAFLMYFLIHNLGECTIVWQNSLEWAVCVATVAGSDPRLQPHFDASPAEDEFRLASSPEYS